MGSKVIEWTLPMARRLRAAHEAAVRAGKHDTDVFVFEGNEFVLGYSYYLLEHLDGLFSEPGLPAGLKATRAPHKES